MTEHDLKTGKELLNEEFIKKNKDWMTELELMVQTKKKAEIRKSFVHILPNLIFNRGIE
jgi:meiotic recombination protein SPO11